MMMLDHLISGASIAGAFFMGTFTMSAAYIIIELELNGALPDNYQGGAVHVCCFTTNIFCYQMQHRNKGCTS
jgi:hypothetical protein